MAEQPAKGPPTTPATAVGASAGTVTLGPPTALTTSSGRMSGVRAGCSAPRSQQSPLGCAALGAVVFTVSGCPACALSVNTPISTPLRRTSTFAGPAGKPETLTQSRPGAAPITAVAGRPAARAPRGGVFVAPGPR